MGSLVRPVVSGICVAGLGLLLWTGWKTLAALDARFISVRVSQLALEDLGRKSFYARLENSFKNHFVFRDEMVRAKQWIDSHLFRTPASTEVYIGRDGWLFFRPEIRDYMKGGCSRQTLRDMLTLAQQLQGLERAVEASGRQFVFLVAPNKATVYREYAIPGSQRSDCGRSRYDRLRESLEIHPIKHFVSLDALIESEKPKRMLYLKTDNHWNYYGGMLASQAILRELAPSSWGQVFPEIKMGTDWQVGNLARMMDSRDPEEVPTAAAIAYRFPVPPLPAAIIYGDSFMAIPMEILGGVFERMAFYDFRLSTIHETLPALRASRIVILEIYELELPRLNYYVRTIASVFQNDAVLSSPGRRAAGTPGVGRAEVFMKPAVPASSRNGAGAG